MTNTVASQTAYAALIDQGLKVTAQTAYATMLAREIEIASQTAYVALLPDPAPSSGRRRMLVVN